MSNRKAEDTFRLWHAKDPRKEFRRRVQYLDGDFARVGLAKEIQYRSDKWEQDGDHHSYVHDFGGSVGVYVPETTVSEDDISGALKNGVNLLGVRGRVKRVEVAQLGTCESLVFTDAVSHEEVVLNFPRSTLLLSSPDRKALIIVDKKRPIIVRGGKMSVTSRGIVN